MRDPSAPSDDQPPSQSESGPDRMRALLVASGLSPLEAARALDVDERTLLYWCQPGGKILPPQWAIEMLGRLIAMRKKGGLRD
jgi:hypothetical protein